jgi:hypothetical protein
MRKASSSWQPPGAKIAYKMRTILFLLLGGAFGSAQKLPSLTPVWSVGPLTQGSAPMGVALGTDGAREMAADPGFQTQSVFAATRSLVFAGDRVVLVSMVGMRRVESAQIPESVYQMISLDVRTGEVRNSREASAFGSLKVFATNDEHVIISGRSLLRLTPDLKDAGAFATGAHWRVENISPDGSTLGNSTSPGFELIDARTLQARKLSNDTITDTSVSSNAAISDSPFWIRDYPKAASFATLTDGTGQYLIFHGDCGGRPVFLNNERVLTASCKVARILDARGNLLKMMTFREPVSFAGASQNGSRFVLQLAGERERFILYATATGDPVAELTTDQPPHGQSWSALSHDGEMIVIGSPAKLTLYRLP